MGWIVPANAGGGALTVIPAAHPRHPRLDRGSMLSVNQLEVLRHLRRWPGFSTKP
jgi:hypothetical protein